MSDPAFDPATLSEDAFLAGPDRVAAWDGEEDLLDVDDVFGKRFDLVLREQREAHAKYGGESVEIEDGALVTPALAEEGYSFVEVEAGLLLLHEDGTVCGGYIGCDVSIDEEHQGLGLGAELILEYAMRHGEIPVWHLDTPAYSRSGAAAHRAAHALAQDRPLFEAKARAIEEARAALSARVSP